MSADDWLTDDDPVEIRIRTTTLDGEGQTGERRREDLCGSNPKRSRGHRLSGRVPRIERGEDPKPDPTNPNSWPLGELVYETEFETNAGGSANDLDRSLAAGMYRANLETKDRFGKAVTAELPLQVLDPEAKKLNLKLPNLFASPKRSLEPGDEFYGDWGSGYDSARAFVEVEHRGKLLQSYWTDAGHNANSDRTASRRNDARRVHSSDDDGARESRLHAIATRQRALDQQTADVEVGTLCFEAQAGGERNLDGGHQRAGRRSGDVAEMVATMYDASLDAYQPHQLARRVQCVSTGLLAVQSMFENQLKNLQHDLPHVERVQAEMAA